MANVRAFTSSSPNFLASILIFVLFLLTSLGIKFGGTPDVVAGEVITVFGTGSLITIISIMAISIGMPIYNFFKTKPKINILEWLGSPNTWIYVGTFVVSLLMLLGIEIPAGTPEAIVAAIVNGNWEALVTVAATNILNPLIRWLRDRGNEVKIAAGVPVT